MSMDLTGITNVNEYYTNHYLAESFHSKSAETIAKWRSVATDSDINTPWSNLKNVARQYYVIHDRFLRSRFNNQVLMDIRTMADSYLKALSYPEAGPEIITIDNDVTVPVYLELKKANGVPELWVILNAIRRNTGNDEDNTSILNGHSYFAADFDNELAAVDEARLCALENEELANKIFFGSQEPPRFIIFIGMNQIALLDRNKWNEKRYLQFELDEIFSRHEDSTLQAMSVLLHKDSLCPDEGKALIDELDEDSQRNAAAVSDDLKYALRESIELLGNEVLYDLKERQGVDLNQHPVDAGQLTIECLRYMYRMLFLLFIESRTELGYAPIKEQVYLTGYSLESLRDIADNINEDVEEVGNGYFLHDTLAKLYDLIYNGYPKTEEEYAKINAAQSKNECFIIHPLKAHIFDPEYTKLITNAKLRNSVMLRIIKLMSLTKPKDGKGRRGRISYANLGINQMGSVYEALLSYRGFIAEHDLYEVQKAGTKFNELEVGYFVTADDLEQYTEEERVYYTDEQGLKHLRTYAKGTFIYRLAGREREKSASYYTPECLTKCLVKYALKELLKDKTADEILHLTVCEPAMGSAAFLNEAINQLAEAYLSKKQQETGIYIDADKRLQELQKVKMFIADRNVYGIDLNSTAVELAEVSLWLNTIYAGGYVPWFGTQLVNGNSLIGARKQCYRIEDLQATSAGMRWYEKAPDRVPLQGGKRQARKQVYHFLLGDPGMANYTDKVIKELEKDNLKIIKDWNKKFTAPYTKDDVDTLVRLSSVIDELWQEQVKNRQELEEATQDKLSVFGYDDQSKDSHTSIRQKDKILHEVYKSEQQRNAGAYARLKFAMDYWCALWFWPIDKADLLPSRTEFLFDLSLILEGTIASVKVSSAARAGQQSLFQGTEYDLEASEAEQLALNFSSTYSKDTVVDIPMLCQTNERLEVSKQIAEQNNFMHWELEFADLFAERGGFDLIVGNPPWIKLEWNEQGVLSDRYPIFTVKKLTAIQTSLKRDIAFKDNHMKQSYLIEYIDMVSRQNFINAIQNYKDLKGQQTNLYKCFLPQAWVFLNKRGISGFLHPDGVFDDPNGEILRESLYLRLRLHFSFVNEKKLFQEVHHSTVFSLNVYGRKDEINFDSICKLYDVKTIDESYAENYNKRIIGLKDDNGKWNINGHPSRILHITKNELKVLAKFTNPSGDYKKSGLPTVYCSDFLSVILKFISHERNFNLLKDNVFSTPFWDETNAQIDIIEPSVGFPNVLKNLVYSGANIGVANPILQTPRKIYRNNSDYDIIDLNIIPDNYNIRTKYIIKADDKKYNSSIPVSNWGRVIDDYHLFMRRMLGIDSERTLICSISCKEIGHINGVLSISFKNAMDMLVTSGAFASIPYDFFLKLLGKTNLNLTVLSSFPVFNDSVIIEQLVIRSLLLNCLNSNYAELWHNSWKKSFKNIMWTKDDLRLNNNKFELLSDKWNWDTPLRTDYERHQALVELDVLVAMELGITLSQLKTMYRIQFPVLYAYERDTWYDANGRITFSAKNYGNLTYKRQEFERDLKNAPAGKKFYRTIIDDTMPGGPIERTIEYVAPFDRCDREKDYETAWKFFEEKYGKVES